MSQEQTDTEMSTQGVTRPIRCPSTITWLGTDGQALRCLEPEQTPDQCQRNRNRHQMPQEQEPAPDATGTGKEKVFFFRTAGTAP